MKKRLKQRIHNRTLEDKGAAFTIEFMFIIILISFIFMSMVDTAMYFSAKGQVQNITQNAARTVAIHGGDNTSITTSKYGGIRPSTTLLSDFNALFKNNAMVKVVGKPTCTPNRVSAAGAKTVSCTLNWEYSSMAPKLFRMVPLTNSTTMSSTSEVWW